MITGDADSDSTSSDEEIPHMNQKDKSTGEMEDQISDKNGPKNIFLEVNTCLKAIFISKFFVINIF